jgi:uncharacterized protein YutE (UPF0331/DUF86 family)
MPPPGVKARIDRFWRAIRRLREISAIDAERFISDENLIDACERNLQVAIEATIDVSEALISYMKWRTPKSYKDVSLILLENIFLNSIASINLLFKNSFKTILVHNYIYLNPRFNAVTTTKEERVEQKMIQ